MSTCVNKQTEAGLLGILLQDKNTGAHGFRPGFDPVGHLWTNHYKSDPSKCMWNLIKYPQSLTWYFENCRCFTKLFFHHKWNDGRLLVINMVYTSCLTSCQTTEDLIKVLLILEKNSLAAVWTPTPKPEPAQKYPAGHRTPQAAPPDWADQNKIICPWKFNTKN